MKNPPPVCIALRPLLIWMFSTTLVGCSAPTTASGSANGLPSANAADARQAQTSVRYPAELIGLWVADGTECPPPDGEYVGDRILEIQPDRLVGYEEVRTPVEVARLAKGSSWTIDALVDVGPSGIFVPDVVATYVLKLEVLTIEQGGRAERYRHCPDL